MSKLDIYKNKGIILENFACQKSQYVLVPKNITRKFIFFQGNIKPMDVEYIRGYYDKGKIVLN